MCEDVRFEMADNESSVVDRPGYSRQTSEGSLHYVPGTPVGTSTSGDNTNTPPSVRSGQSVDSIRTSSLDTTTRVSPEKLVKDNGPCLDGAVRDGDIMHSATDSLKPRYQQVRRHDIGTQWSPMPRLTRRFPSLKLSRNFGRFGSLRSHVTTGSTPTLADRRRKMAPAITVTMDDSENESVISDYLSPDRNYRRDTKVQFSTDEGSLYGTPKEEKGPWNDQKTSNSSASFLREQIIAFFQPSDNKLAMKLFGNKNALMKEKRRQQAVGNWVIHPCSNFR